MPGESWQQAWVEVLPDLSEFKRKANSEITPSLSRAGAQGATAFGHSFTGQIFKGSFAANIGARLAVGIVAGIGQGIRAGVDFSTEAVQFASSLGEQVNAVQVAFGDVGDEILALSQKAPRNLNLTRSAFDKLAVRFSSFASTISKRGGSTAQVIQNLTQRGADFASVYDIEVGEALELFQSGLAGQSEPLRRYGLDLSEATTKQFAYREGIAAVGAELTEAQKIQARYGSLIEQTNKVEGDLANTRGSLANQQRALNVALEEAQTSFGENLLPTAVDLATFANDELVPMLNEALDVAGPELASSLRGALPEIKETLAAAAEALPDAIEAAGGFAELFAKSASGDLGEGGIISGFLDLANTDRDRIEEVAEDSVTTFLNALTGDARAQEAIGDWFDAAWFGAGVHNERVAKEQAEKLAESYSIAFATADGWDRALDPIEKLGIGVAEGGADAMAALTAAIASGKPSAIAEALGLKLGIEGHIKDLGVRAPDLGKTFIDGLTKALRGGKVKVGLAAGEVAQAAVDAVRKTLDSHSPSRVMWAEGENAIDGLIGGWESKALDPISLPTVSVPSSGVRAAAIAGSAVSPELPPIYVQNPFTGEYLLARVDGRIQQADARNDAALAGGVLR